ncbi:hypothetical protein D5S17_09320 [Pseudonocardiaceae bacterium YIM PH 21723]|nr:hypothetical protein D5S17_09320 [Pseudonocardiaceae bacterium YIM PH 21723]
MDTEPAASRVALGVAWLNENKPGWRAADFEYLDISSAAHCILGRVFETEGHKHHKKGYFYVLEHLLTEDDARYPNRWAMRHGFLWYPPEEEAEDELEEEWSQVLGLKKLEAA